MKITELEIPDYERVASCAVDGDYRGFIAIHSTKLGPAVGGTRFWKYESDEAAIKDLLRLARGMTYKNALAGIPFGGGKSIVLRRDGAIDREEIFRAHGRFVESFGGQYITAEDVGTNPDDMAIVREKTKHVAGLHGLSGDPSPFTARGVFRAMRAAAKYRWGSESLAGRTVALQGCGNVGYHVASKVSEAGARLIVSDVDATKTERLVKEFGATAAAPDTIYAAKADVFAPCALGGVINDETIPQFKVEIIAGGANNQLLESRHGDELEKRGILYAPDYAANSGGIINGCRELLGWEASQSLAKVDEIYDTVLDIFRTAEAEGIPTNKAADRLAEQRLKT
ncbi:MAG TPA: amino acid dehydrogenase [Pyrinomonadaceae bacterium]|nr:amino acid dehydrogenase [Pyrinomonadaceae bacterium]